MQKSIRPRMYSAMLLSSCALSIAPTSRCVQLGHKRRLRLQHRHVACESAPTLEYKTQSSSQEQHREAYAPKHSHVMLSGLHASQATDEQQRLHA